jgi:ATP-binding cassette, subfamily B, bacterial MsbA
MDEPTSNLDDLSKNLILNQLKCGLQGSTILYSAHRRSMIERADHIVVMCQGTAIAEGIHKQLLEQCGYYRKLIGSQD